MNTHYAQLLRVADALEATDPLHASQLRYYVSSLVPGATIRPGWAFAIKIAAKGGDKALADKLKKLIQTMEEAKQGLEATLTEDDQAFLKFYDGGGKDDLQSEFDEVDELLQMTASIARVGSSNRYAEGFSEFFKSVKDDLLGGGASEFFEGADDVLKQLEEAKKNPGDQALINGLIAQLQDFIDQGNALLEKAVEYDDSDINPEGKGVTLEDNDLNPVDAGGADISFDDEGEPAELQAKGELGGYELERVVGHYVDLLQKALQDKDEGAINKFLKELFAETQTNVEEEEVKVAARRHLRARLLPILTRLAFKRPHLRPMLVPYLKVATARHRVALGLGQPGKYQVIQNHNGYEELRGQGKTLSEAKLALQDVGGLGKKDFYIKDPEGNLVPNEAIEAEALPDSMF